MELVYLSPGLKVQPTVPATRAPAVTLVSVLPGPILCLSFNVKGSPLSTFQFLVLFKLAWRFLPLSLKDPDRQVSKWYSSFLSRPPNPS